MSRFDERHDRARQVDLAVVAPLLERAGEREQRLAGARRAGERDQRHVPWLRMAWSAKVCSALRGVMP